MPDNAGSILKAGFNGYLIRDKPGIGKRRFFGGDDE
jgi:hypothetical protein